MFRERSGVEAEIDGDGEVIDSEIAGVVVGAGLSDLGKILSQFVNTPVATVPRNTNRIPITFMRNPSLDPLLFSLSLLLVMRRNTCYG